MPSPYRQVTVWSRINYGFGLFHVKHYSLDVTNTAPGGAPWDCF